MLKYAFEMKAGCGVHVVLIIAAMVCLLLVGFYKKIDALYCAKYITHIHLFIVLVQVLSMLHSNFISIGDNVLFNNNPNLKTKEWLFDEVYFEGWCGYVIILACIILCLKLEYRKKAIQIKKTYTIGIPILIVLGVMSSNIINIFCVGETYNGLDSLEDFTYKATRKISEVIFGNTDYFYHSINIIIPIAIVVYSAIYISICLSLYEDVERIFRLKCLKWMNIFSLSMFVYFATRLLLEGIEIAAFVPLILVNIVMLICVFKIMGKIQKE